MRIAAVNSHHARIGGAETYLDTVIPALAAASHQIAFYSEFEAPPGAPLIRLPDRAPVWCASEMGARQALAALKQWRPDVIYVHGINLPSAVRIAEIAPAVLFAHGYYGTCISGNKMLWDLYQRQQDVRRAAPAAVRAALRIAMLRPLLPPSMRRVESDADVNRLSLAGRAPWPDAPLRRCPDCFGSYARRIRAPRTLT